MANKAHGGKMNCTINCPRGNNMLSGKSYNFRLGVDRKSNIQVLPTALLRSSQWHSIYTNTRVVGWTGPRSWKYVQPFKRNGKSMSYCLSFLEPLWYVIRGRNTFINPAMKRLKGSVSQRTWRETSTFSFFFSIILFFIFHNLSTQWSACSL